VLGMSFTMRILPTWASGVLILAFSIAFCALAQDVDFVTNSIRKLPNGAPAQNARSGKSPSKASHEDDSSLGATIRSLPSGFTKPADVKQKGDADPQPVSPIAETLRSPVTRVGFADEFSKAYDPINSVPPFDSHETILELPSNPSVLTPEQSFFVPTVPRLAQLPDKKIVKAETNDNDFQFRVDEDPEAEIARPEPFATDRLSQEFIGLEQPTGASQDTEDTFWWKKLVNHPLHPDDTIETTDTNTLIYNALKNSPRIQAISKDPLIRDLQVTEAESEFDVVSFLSSQFDDRNDPVGNTLTTGGAPFLQDHIWSGEGGVRKKLVTGANLELGQRLGFQNSNSRFFVPQDQGTATLSLNFTQPLLRGRGRFYNQSQILIAQSAGGVAWEAFKAELQQELESVVESYWRLYFERSVYLQKKHNVARGELVLELIEGRSELDSLPSQIARVRSAVTSRKTDFVNAFNEVRNTETEVRRLIADPNWLANQNIELLPLEPAMKTESNQTLTQVVETALENRPEIKESLQRAKIAAIQYDVGTNELLPELSFLFGGYISALAGESNIGSSIQNQFQNTPGYSVGLEFEFPIKNRAARSRLAQRNVQRAKIANEVDEIVQNVIAEAQVAYRRVITAHKTMDAATSAIEAARADLTQSRQRWQSFALVEGDLADGQTPTTVLDQLLDSQDRLTNAEFVFSQAELELKLAEVGLRRVTGTLLQHEQVSFIKQYENGTPSVTLDQGQTVESIEPPPIESKESTNVPPPIESKESTNVSPPIESKKSTKVPPPPNPEPRKNRTTHVYPLDDSPSR